MTDEELNARFSMLAAAQIRFQDQVSEIVQVFRERIEAQDRLVDVIQARITVIETQVEAIQAEVTAFQAEVNRIQAETERNRERQDEADQRFNVLLEEVRYLIRQMGQPPGS